MCSSPTLLPDNLSHVFPDTCLGRFKVIAVPAALGMEMLTLAQLQAALMLLSSSLPSLPSLRSVDRLAKKP